MMNGKKNTQLEKNLQRLISFKIRLHSEGKHEWLSLQKDMARLVTSAEFAECNLCSAVPSKQTSFHRYTLQMR